MVAKILVADDQPDSLVMMLHQLKARGYSTMFATDGAEAMRLAEEERPDVIICQWRFSTVGGARIAQRLADASSPARVTLLALFDAATPSIGGWTTPPGCAGHLVKPIEPGHFIATVERHIPPAARPTRLTVRPFGRRRLSDRM